MSQHLDELVDRAFALMGKIADAAEEASEPFDAAVPVELAMAWVDKQALSHVMTVLIDSEVIPRERLKELFVAGRELADQYEDPNADALGFMRIEDVPGFDQELIEELTQLEEEVRRARLLEP